MKANNFGKTNKEDLYSVYWASHTIRGEEYKRMKSWQRCNQFPRTHEITRKDALARNIKKMQQIHALRDFDFLPSSFVLPAEMPAFRVAFAKNAKSCSNAWIVKPSNSSCGKGIYVTSELKEILNPGFEMDCTYVSSLGSLYHIHIHINIHAQNEQVRCVKIR
jgi:hypothetical protein